jgi:hypothetical protein
MTGHGRDGVSWTDEAGVFGVTLGAPPNTALDGPVISGLTEAPGAFGRPRARALMLSSAVPDWFAVSGPSGGSGSADLSTIEHATRLPAGLRRLAGADRPSIAGGRRAGRGRGVGARDGVHAEHRPAERARGRFRMVSVVRSTGLEPARSDSSTSWSMTGTPEDALRGWREVCPLGSGPP